MPDTCLANNCSSEPIRGGLCSRHYRRYNDCGRPDLGVWLGAGAPTDYHWCRWLAEESAGVEHEDWR